jgi:alkanesulfonate monooxygenase SsuD/methylene tetrahydromethanopterin reductase-like flavin-dependent oxidoreductase (luciferase family)
MTDIDISFGLVLTPTGSGRAWTEQARSAEQQGWTSVLVPDTLWTPSTFPTLAAAAAVTTTLRLRTWVLAAPLRSPAAVVRESSALQVLSDGRFELGIGTGRPDAEREAGLLGVPWGSAADRIRQVEQVVAAVREQVHPVPRIVVTAAGPRMLAAAARSADRIGLALPPNATDQDLATSADRVRALASGPIGLSQQLSGLSGRLPAWLTSGGLDPQALADAGATGMLVGDAAAMAETLRRRAETVGVSEFIVPGELADDFAPVIGLLSA